MDYDKLHADLMAFGKEMLTRMRAIDTHLHPMLFIHASREGDGMKMTYSLHGLGRGDNIDNVAHPGEMIDEWCRRRGWATQQEQKVLANVEVLQIGKTPNDQPF